MKNIRSCVSETIIIDLAIRAEDDRIKREIERMRYQCGYGEANEEIKEEQYRRSRQEQGERNALSELRKDTELVDKATRECMTSALEALKELSDPSSRKNTLRFNSFALTNLRVQRAAAINRSNREEMPEHAGTEEERRTEATADSCSSGSQAMPRTALAARAVKEKNDTDEAMSKATEDKDK